MLGQTRIFYVMARDRMLPPICAQIDPRTRTPVAATMLTGIAIAALALIVPLNELLNLVNIGTLIAFMVVCFGVLVMRRYKPDLRRPFRVPFVPLFPILGIVFSGFLGRLRAFALDVDLVQASRSWSDSCSSSPTDFGSPTRTRSRRSKTSRNRVRVANRTRKRSHHRRPAKSRSLEIFCNGAKLLS